MTLVPLRRTQTIINVNGSEEGSFSQSSDSSYNISISTSANVSNSQTISEVQLNRDGSDGWSNTGGPDPIVHTVNSGSLDGSLVSCELVATSLSPFDRNVVVTVDGQEFVFEFSNGNPWSSGETKTFSFSNGVNEIVFDRGDGGNSFEYEAYLRLTIESNPSVSTSSNVDDVTQL